jgi:hypothetical protein
MCDLTLGEPLFNGDNGVDRLTDASFCHDMYVQVTSHALNYLLEWFDDPCARS